MVGILNAADCAYEKAQFAGTVLYQVFKRYGSNAQKAAANIIAVFQICKHVKFLSNIRILLDFVE